MAKLKVYEYPHPILKKKAEKVEKVDDELRKFLDDMLETMYESVGVGLAAPQVGVSKRIVVIDAAREDEEPAPMYFINPEIVGVRKKRKFVRKAAFRFRKCGRKSSVRRA